MLVDVYEAIITNYCNLKITTKTNKPAKSLGKFSFKILISDLSKISEGKLVTLPALQTEKATINLGLVTENL